MMEKVVLDLSEIGDGFDERYFLEVNPGDYSMDFSLKENIIANGLKDQDVLIVGHLKWDGCINWSTRQQVMYHFCSEDDLTILNIAFKKVWELGKKHIKNWLDD